MKLLPAISPSQHTNFSMAAASLTAAVDEIGRLLGSNPAAPAESPPSD